MKNYIIGALIATVIALSSFLYKYSVNDTNKTFSLPLSTDEIKTDGTPKLLLLVFFSRNNCRDCLGIIDVLNNMPSSQFIVRGVIPDKELENIEEVRTITNAVFPIQGEKKFKNFTPKYSPAIVGASVKGDLFFILPGVPGGRDCTEMFLYSLYYKLQNYLPKSPAKKN